MLCNICFAWIISFVLIVGYGYISHQRRTTRKVSGFVQAMGALTLMIASIFYYSASASLGAIATLFLIAPSGEAAARLEIGMGIIFGMWVMAILLQLCMNVSAPLCRRPSGAHRFFQLRSAQVQTFTP